MFRVSKNPSLRRFFMSGAFVFVLGLFPLTLSAQTQVENPTDTSNSAVDPRLYQIVETIKDRMQAAPSPELLRGSKTVSQDELYVDLLDEIQIAAYSNIPEQIKESVTAFREVYKQDTSLDLRRIPFFYEEYAQQLESGRTTESLQALATRYSENGSWIERYIALTQSSILFSEKQERQAALQKAQEAFSVIPHNSDVDLYVKFAKTRTTGMIAHLHNLQGNSELALITSLDYLKLTEDDPDLKSEVDLINNLIYSYTISRDHDAQLFLTQELLEIEKSHTSSVVGLSEMRIAGVMNAAGRFQEGLEYANLALNKAENPTVIRVSQIAKGISLAGLGNLDRARAIAKRADVNFDKKHMLETETRQGDLYLAFLLAQSEDTIYATQLFNRQLDVTAQKFLANNSRDTTAMLAELENTRGRQAEREAAAARETRLQALTIDRQKKLNRTLIALSIFLALGTLFAVLFIRFREKVLRKLEIKTIEAASAEKLKTEFLGMISHELRTPLNGIIGISDFLANYHEDPDIREKTGIVLRSGNELLSVVESLTDMARLDAGQLKLVPHDADLSLSLAEVHKPWAEKAADKDLTFTHFIDPSIASYHVDEDRVIQCLNILLANAISFTETGRVHLHITGNKTAQGDVTSLTAVVADTGQGMSELVQSRLFTPFMQADTSRRRTHMGTGLSLAIAYALAEMMGGELSVMSREGRGSEFKFNVPLGVATKVLGRVPADLTEIDSAEIAQNVEAVSETSFMDVPVLDTSDGPNREVFDLMKPSIGRPGLHDVAELVLPTPAEGQQRILVVDDMASNRDVLRLILESQGHICSEATDGFEALTALDQEPFDMVVLDIHMTPLDGVETLRRLRGSGKAYAQIPVVALTADNAASTNAACMEAGADLFLTKPARQEELLRAISYLQQAEGARILSQ